MTTDVDGRIDQLLDCKRIAVVGCSRTLGKDAHDVPAYLLEQGYDIVPVNPHAEEIFGRAVADSLTTVEETIDVVCIFRPSDEVAGIVAEARSRGDVQGIWTQRGIRDDDAANTATRNGIVMVQDRCMKVEHQQRRQ